MDRTFEYVETQTIGTLTEFRDGFEFRSDKKYHWIQNVCFWILRKIGAYRRENVFTYKRYTINPDSFMERLFKQHNYLQREFNIKPSELFIGAEDHAIMMGSDEIKQMLSFNATYNYRDGYGSHVMGLKIHVIPWMRGIIVMP
jgi:hypothetical protein